MLNDVRPTDLTVFAVTAVAVVLVALLASYFPRALGPARVDPMVVLRGRVRDGDWGLGTGDWGLGDWGLGTGDWGLGTGDCQSPIPNP